MTRKAKAVRSSIGAVAEGWCPLKPWPIANRLVKASSENTYFEFSCNYFRLAGFTKVHIVQFFQRLLKMEEFVNFVLWN